MTPALALLAAAGTSEEAVTWPTLPPKNNTYALGQLHMQDGQPVYGRLVQKFGA
jgi:hypothetical protein